MSRYNRMITSFRRLLLAVPILLCVFTAQAQDEDPDPCGATADKKIVKLLDEAAKAKDPGERHRALKETIEMDPQCAECLFRLGNSAYSIAKQTGRDFDPAIRYFDQLNSICPQYHADVPYHLGLMYYVGDKFAEAAKYFTDFQKFPIDDPSKLSKDHEKKLSDVEELMPELSFYMDFFKNDVAFDPKLIQNVSTPADEYLPMLSPDNELLFFTRVSKSKAKGDILSTEIEQLIEARRTDLNKYDGGRVLPEPFNVGDSYGGVSISLNNKEMYVTICGKADARGYRNCDIFRSHFETKYDLDRGGPSWEWGGLQDLGPNINTPDGWESQPSLSADGNTLYFAAQRANTKGMDIYQSSRGANGEWSKAVPVPVINTDGDEKAPFMHTDSRTLYFAARPSSEDQEKGYRGAGGYDIFYSRLGDDGTWSRPKNVGHPISTDQDEHGMIVSTDGRTAYFASNRFKGAGGLDIYSFEMPQEARPEDVLVVKGEVRDDKGEVVRDAQIEIKYMDTRKVELIDVDKDDGRYATVVNLKQAGDVVLTVKKQDHVFDSRSFGSQDTARGGVAEVDMMVQKIEVGKNYKVNDIKYGTNSAEITDASKFILDELIDFLKENPSVKIRIDGHTDNVGGSGDNMVLSENRAENVRRYLQEHGIAAARLSSKGFGPTVPVADNSNEEGRAQNRRTEFVIIGK